LIVSVVEIRKVRPHLVHIPDEIFRITLRSHGYRIFPNKIACASHPHPTIRDRPTSISEHRTKTLTIDDLELADQLWSWAKLDRT